MSSSSEFSPPSSETLSHASSELNNLLQIISSTNALLEKVPEGTRESEEYRTMLRASIDRVEKLSVELARQAGGTDMKEMVHPDLSMVAPPKTEQPSAGSKRSVLLVDDEEMALTLVKRILNEAGFNATTASSGFQCLEFVRRQPHAFDLVLLDLTMPFMDGEETFQRLREIREDMPVVLCTGFIQHERLSRLMSAGLTGFLRKPIAPDEIVSFVRSTLASVKYARNGTSPYGASSTA